MFQTKTDEYIAVRVDIEEGEDIKMIVVRSPISNLDFLVKQLTIKACVEYYRELLVNLVIHWKLICIQFAQAVMTDFCYVHVESSYDIKAIM